MNTTIKRILREETYNDQLLRSMVNFLKTHIKEIKKVDDTYYFLENPSDEYCKIKYHQIARNAYYYVGLSGEISKVYGKELVQRVGISNIVERYVEDTLNVVVSNTIEINIRLLFMLKTP